MSRSIVTGHFLQGRQGSVFVLMREPAQPAAGCVLVVPAFAEEMNKSRRMVTEVALGLAERGVCTVAPDLFGTGDSGGDFADATWPTWLGDLDLCRRWCEKSGHPVTGVLAMRFGCALAAAAVNAGSLPAVPRTVLWQPVFDGARYLGQFLRLRTAALLMEHDRKETVQELRAQLLGGATIEVAGYSLSGRLAGAIEAAAAPSHLPAQVGETHWMEVVRDAEAALPGASEHLIGASRTVGRVVHASTFPGEPFWTSTEVVRNRAMIDATIEAFSS